MRPRALLVTFDAWRTLFFPSEPVAAQYTRLARQHGMKVEESDVRDGFRKAFKTMSSKYPNYGKSFGMKPEQWWTELMIVTFAPKTVPPSLPPAIISHFANKDAYTLHTSIPFLLHTLRTNKVYSETVIGVVSNSDLRVPSILQSLGVAVKNYPQSGSDGIGGENGTIDFVTLSYNVGVEKPDSRIFAAALEVAKKMSCGEEKEWAKVHVGDDYEKDVMAAQSAGWVGLMWDGERKPEQVLDNILAG